VIQPESAASRRFRQFGFGGCCDRLRTAFELPNSHFLVDDEGALFVTTGWVEGGEGLGEYHSAVLFCPFCGASLQSADKIRYLSLGPG